MPTKESYEKLATLHQEILKLIGEYNRTATSADVEQRVGLMFSDGYETGLETPEAMNYNINRWFPSGTPC